MMVKGFKILMLTAMLCVGLGTKAQQSQPVITDYIEQSSGGKVTVVQDDALRERLKRKEVSSEDAMPEEKAKVVGYRVQVYSDNNQRTGKSQAQSRQQKILEQFPDMKVYVIYTSPTWRVRVGDFKLMGEAEFVMHELKEAFPAYAREMMIVKDNINVPEK